MAHFAELDESNTVLRVIVVGDEHEEDGEEWCRATFGGHRWKRTSYSGSIRKSYAGAGHTYDEGRDAFIPPKPHPSWHLNEETCQWEPPTTPLSPEGNTNGR